MRRRDLIGIQSAFLVVMVLASRATACEVSMSIGATGIVALNDDDDDWNATADKDESSTHKVDGENDLVALQIGSWGSITGTVTLSATSGESKIKVWKSYTHCDDNLDNDPDLVGLPASWEPDELPSCLYVEGMAASGATGDVVLKLEWTGSGKTPNPMVTKTLTVVEEDVDIDGIVEADELTKGAVVIKNFQSTGTWDPAPPRKKVTLRCTPAHSAILTRFPGKVRVFDAETGGNEILFNGDNEFENLSSMDLWVEGYQASLSVADTVLSLNPDYTCAYDEVSFTVLWVTVSTDHSNIVNTDNIARGDYSDQVVPSPDYSLGHHLFIGGTYGGTDGVNGRGSEFLGTVHPADFVPSQFNVSMNMSRWMVSGSKYWGATGKEFREFLPEGPDETESTVMRDDDPQSGSSGGVIYDLDVPSVDALYGASPNDIIRLRHNFTAFAKCGNTRCSDFAPWFTRQSYKKSGAADGGTSTGATWWTLTDTGKAWTADQWVPGLVRAVVGQLDEVRRIAGNTATTITVDDSWESQPISGSLYEVINTSTWSLENGASGDNQSADGTTVISWDLNSPTITGITPNSGTHHEQVTITNLAGTSFVTNATVKLVRSGQSDIAASDVTVESVQKITCKFDLTGAATGTWSVTVTNPGDSTSGVLTNGFTIND